MCYNNDLFNLFMKKSTSLVVKVNEGRNRIDCFPDVPILILFSINLFFNIILLSQSNAINNPFPRIFLILFVLFSTFKSCSIRYLPVFFELSNKFSSTIIYLQESPVVLGKISNKMSITVY